MSKQRHSEEPVAEAAKQLPAAPGPHIIDPRAVYSVAEAQQALGLRASTIRRELREGRLKVSKRAGKHFLLGRWLLEWIEGGLITRRTPSLAGATNGDTTESG